MNSRPEDKNLIVILNAFLGITLFRNKPQDLPASNFLLNTALCLYVSISLIHTVIYENFDKAIMVTIVDLLLLLGLVYIWLALFGFRNRWQQTVTAIAGGSSVLGFVAIPVSLILTQVNEDTLFVPLASYLMLFLFVWTIGLYSFVFRHAFSILTVFAVILAICYNILVYIVVSTLVPGLNS